MLARPNPSSAKTRFPATSFGTMQSIAWFQLLSCHHCHHHHHHQNSQRASCPPAALPGPRPRFAIHRVWSQGLQFNLIYRMPNTQLTQMAGQTHTLTQQTSNTNYQIELWKQCMHAQCTACTNRALPKFSQSQSHFVEMPKMHHGQSFVSLLLIVHVTKAGRKETCPHIGLSERSPASTKDLVLHVVQRLCISVGPELGHSKSNIQVYSGSW